MTNTGSKTKCRWEGCRELDDLKYVSALNEELKEETKEYLADNSIDELAYIIGVIEALAITKGSNLDEV